MRGDDRPKAPNYTNAALTMGLVNLVWLFCVIWAVFGFAVVIFAALALNWLIDVLARRRA
ncbi:hypothetical protein ACOXXX_19080 [Thalassococcus sp. BH17M4-6]|uniref:hypothetical protein n=1 Tax=Thalassococcus sp. BH17M4-6 TaxID=3413148 RepID=UPI003BE73C3C